MKNLFLTIIVIFCYSTFFASDDKTVTLITSGQGQTLDEAKQKALRNAIEQAFGAFISSHTELVNDNLVRDEIISVSNGNIQKYEIISETVLPDNMGFATTIKSIVSISKLTSFCESKGMKIEIQGALFAFNVIQKELSATNEAKVMNELVSIAEKIAPKMFDYSISSKDPVKVDFYFKSPGNVWVQTPFCLPLKVNLKINKNWEEFRKLLMNTLKSLSLISKELEDYKKINLPITTIEFYSNNRILNGKFYFKKYDSATDKLTEQKYEELLWGDILEDLSYSTFSEWGLDDLNRNHFPGYSYSIVPVGFEKDNYELNRLFFRTDVNKSLQLIFQILRDEAYNFNIVDASNYVVVSAGLSNEWEWKKDDKKYWNWGRFMSPLHWSHEENYRTLDNISCPDQMNQKNTINKIEPNSIIGFSYYCPLFSLDQIKTLTKLEIKHN